MQTIETPLFHHLHVNEQGNNERTESNGLHDLREFFSDMAFLRESIDLVLFVVDVNERTQLDLYRVTRQTMYFCSTFLLSSEEDASGIKEESLKTKGKEKRKGIKLLLCPKPLYRDD